MKYILRNLTKNISLVYGFRDNQPRYNLIATLHKKFNTTKIYGMLSKKNIQFEEFVTLWKFLQKNVTSKFIQFECIPLDARVYKTFLEPVKIKKTSTFNDFECEQITILTNSKIRIGK